MTASLLIECLALGLLLCCSAFFSSAETALFSLNPVQIHRLRRYNQHTAVRIERLLARPMRLLSTVLIGNTLVNVGASALGYVIAETLFPQRGAAIAIVTMTGLLVV